ncbi:hypothetical protein [Brevundimonas halotolerans]|uniref:Uncharacterized protein YwgA n=1 Tax=Brevundimonas halotolerans TaxID=69670 RepID=A0A7W9E6U2_9CAUL|nr:hypothetical protein [Brevundimonas halotolerans]MBB5660667.1 uncharacterized protein YwgA [Brevundimonas halotolerans]
MLNDCNTVHAIVSAAGGELVGKTRLQKIAFILKAAGLSGSLSFRYHYYGPYSEDLAFEMKEALVDGLIEMEDRPASWGGTFTVFRSNVACKVDGATQSIVDVACAYDSIALELAATAAFLRKEMEEGYWEETSRRKPQKATPERISQAKDLWGKLLEVETPTPLPAI